MSKTQIGEPLFQPLVRGIIDQNRLRRKLTETKLKSVASETVRRLVATLRHEINNPLGAVLGAAYLLRTSSTASPEQVQAASLVEESGQRIKLVLDKLCEEIELEPVEKAHQQVFQIPGDKPWEDSSNPSNQRKNK